MPRRIAMLMLMSALAIAGSASRAVSAPAFSDNPTPPAARTPIDDLKHLIELAPARQVGQTGNDAVDHMIQQRFADAVAHHNDPARWSDAQAALDTAAKTDAAFTAARDAARITPESTSMSEAAASGGWSAAVLQMVRESVAFTLDVSTGLTCSHSRRRHCSRGGSSGGARCWLWA
jgi:hypothetical protein